VPRRNSVCGVTSCPRRGAGGSSRAAAAAAAKLRYQRTKIDDAPDTILVDDEIVAIIRADQQRVRNRIPSSRVLLR
jgi:hypothetical protein